MFLLMVGFTHRAKAQSLFVTDFHHNPWLALICFAFRYSVVCFALTDDSFKKICFVTFRNKRLPCSLQTSMQNNIDRSFLVLQPTELTQKWRPFMSRKVGAKGIAAILILVFTLLGHNNSIADTAGFSGDFAPANWTVTQNNSNGSVSTINAPTSITITGPNNGSNQSGFTKYTIAAPSNGTVRFNWAYSTNDGAAYDYPQFYINGTPSMLSSYQNNGGQNQNGTGSYVLTAGTLFGFAV
jgi:hypothetical protein